MLRFRPYPGFTLFTAISIALLCGLGVWQGMIRLPWKLELIASIHRGLAAPAMPIETAWLVGANHASASNAMTKMDYGKVSLQGHFLNHKEVYFFATGMGGAPNYHVLAPFVMKTVLPSGDPAHPSLATILVDRGYVPPELMDSQKRAAGQLEGERTIAGVLRKPDAPNFFTPPADRARRVTYTRDPKTVSATFGLAPLLPMFLEADATPNPGGWPKGGQTVVDLPNNHLSYAATWFGLAAGLLGVWLAYHVSKGRLAWGKG
jgi:surfeit locus 1 family protein